MVQITVRFSGPLRQLAGRQSLALSLSHGATVRHALSALRAHVPAAFVERVIDPLECGVAPATLVLRNTHPLRSSLDLDVALAAGDVLAFVLPMEGG